MNALIAAGIFLLAMIGTPLFAVIALATLVGYAFSDIELSVLAIEMYRIAETPLLVALPLFVIAGYVLSASQAAHRMVALSQALLGWLPHGFIVISLISCALFTAFTGASGATIVALGALLYPALRELGYQERFSLGLVTGGGSLGLLLVPSIPLILYGVIVQQMDMGPSFTLNELFLAGLLPSLLLIVLLCLWVYWQHRHQPLPTQPFNIETLRRALWEARWELPLPVVVLGGVYGGLFAISDVAAVTAAYVLIVEVLLNREVPARQLPQIFAQAAVMVGGILLILGVSLAFSNLVIDADVPGRLLAWIRQYIDNRWTFLLLLNLVLLLIGAMLDIFSAIVIVVPIILPIALSFDVHPVHLGMIFLTNLQIGYLTPPVGMSLFIASYRFEKPITTLFRASLPFMLVLLIGLAIITWWPALSLVWLPD